MAHQGSAVITLWGNGEVGIGDYLYKLLLLPLELLLFIQLLLLSFFSLVGPTCVMC